MLRKIKLNRKALEKTLDVGTHTFQAIAGGDLFFSGQRIMEEYGVRTGVWKAFTGGANFFRNIGQVGWFLFSSSDKRNKHQFWSNLISAGTNAPQIRTGVLTSSNADIAAPTLITLTYLFRAANYLKEHKRSLEQTLEQKGVKKFFNKNAKYIPGLVQITRGIIQRESDPTAGWALICGGITMLFADAGGKSDKKSQIQQPQTKTTGQNLALS